MSESSLSSLEFIRSVTSLTREDSRAQTYDVDELFSFDDARQTLTKRLTEATSRLSLEKAPESSPHRTASSLIASLSSPSEQPRPSVTFAPWRVFLNCVDTFACKYIARHLASQVYGSTRMTGAEEGVAEEETPEIEDEEMSFLQKSRKDEVPKFRYTIIGSLSSPEAKYEGKYVTEILDTSNKDSLLQTVISCGFVIYDISRRPDQIEEAGWVLSAIERRLKRIELDTPKAFMELKDVPAFVLISSVLTWAQTKPVDPEEPELPLREMDYKKRKCHPNFKRHFELEKEVVAAGKKWPDKFRTLVLCSGVQYGYEEDTLNFLFKLAWENQPELPSYLPGKNYIPLIHVQDLAAMVFQVLELFPGLKYILAVEQNLSTLKSITKAVSKGLSTGDTVKLPKEDMLLITEVSQHVYDCMTINVRLEPTYFTEQVKFNWRVDTSFSSAMTRILREYRQCRGLTPIRILLAGPPACGKTLLAKKLAAYYQIHYLSPQSIAERAIDKLRYKIEQIKEKEKAAMEKDLEKEEEAESDEEEEEQEEEEILEESDEDRLESTEELTEELEELLLNMEENDGRLDEEHLLKCLKEILASPPIRNQGYVLDGFPETVEQLKLVFASSRADEDEDMSGEWGNDKPVAPSIYPDYLVGLEASNGYIVDRVIELPEEEIQEKHYSEEELMRRLATYRAVNAEDSGLLDHLDALGVHPLVLSVEDDHSGMLEDTLQKIVRHVGEPHNFGISPEEALERQRLEEDQQKWMEAQELARKQEAEKQAHAERMRKLQQWVTTMDALKEEEEEAFAADSRALRNYLKRYIFPTLTRGLKEVARLRPEDPIDFLAEFLFKENPEGKVFEPDNTHQSRKLFDEMLRKRQSMYSLTTPKDHEDAEALEADKTWQFVAETPHDTYY